MRYVRFALNDETQFGLLMADGRIQPLSAAPYAGGQPVGEPVDAASVRLVAPCEPTKIIAVGKNYHDHIKEFDGTTPETPILFIKPNTAINDPEAPITLPPRSISKRVDYEGELALIISRKATRVRADEALDYVQGYTILNDVTARDVQKADGQWIRAKGMDGFSPIGPLVTDEIDPAHVGIRTRLNGKTVQESSTDLLIWSVPALIEFITETITLLPGDVVTTGTPSGVGPMGPGDVVEIEIDGIGVLRNTIIDRA